MVESRLMNRVALLCSVPPWLLCSACLLGVKGGGSDEAGADTGSSTAAESDAEDDGESGTTAGDDEGSSTTTGPPPSTTGDPPPRATTGTPTTTTPTTGASMGSSTLSTTSAEDSSTSDASTSNSSASSTHEPTTGAGGTCQDFQTGDYRSCDPNAPSEHCSAENSIGCLPVAGADGGSLCLSCCETSADCPATPFGVAAFPACQPGDALGSPTDICVLRCETPGSSCGGGFTCVDVGAVGPLCLVPN